MAHTTNSATAFGITTGYKLQFLSTPLGAIPARVFSAGVTRNEVSMLATGSGGIEELKEMLKEGDKLTQSVRKSPGPFQSGSYGRCSHKCCYYWSRCAPGSIQRIVLSNLPPHAPRRSGGSRLTRQNVHRDIFVTQRTYFV